ncbi:GNAT family N-acetyltransferase [Microbacterium hominis]|uniref:GNAT family N-acetyltransferase n=1 Tax=Microbacterium TaxID=33882 RepID=UPI00168A4BB7|nr:MULTISPECIES: GNAT family N-acetyltransferase [Microbacterium]QOC25923.1 GNAT family N-acetyltransferase [Microbacterium hominis]QOC29901.1 GNAT family N-acetyltransferase [Microbacterium hominis]QYF97704.1 GNAT family N-acetyltransferase [Microbacterium sp. PAMC21962]
MVRLEPLTADDPRSRALLEEYFRMRAAAFPQGQAYQPVFPAASVFTPPAGVFLVVVDDDGADATDAGCGGIRRIEDGPAGPRHEVKHLYLQPRTRGRGWGRLLLEALEERARGFGAAELVLDTHHTLDAAGALYARSGFTAVEPYNDNPNATVWLRKAL